MNSQNNLSDAMRLLSLYTRDEADQSDGKQWRFNVISEDGKPKINVEFKGGTKTFFPEDISSMVLNSMKETAATRVASDIAQSIGDAISISNDIEKKLQDTRVDLRDIKDTAFKIRKEEEAIEARNENIKESCRILQELVDNLKLPDKIYTDLFESHFDNVEDIENISRALDQIQKVVSYEVKPIFKDLQSVKTQKEHAENLKYKFCLRLSKYISDFTDTTMMNSVYNQPLFLMSYEMIQEHLTLMQPTIQWLEKNYPPVYQQVCNTLLDVQKNYDIFIHQQIQAVRESKPPKRPRCGVLDIVKSFEQFAIRIENAFASMSTARRTDIDRYYLELVPELFKTIDRTEHSKTPTEMIRLENYNYLVNALRSIKVPCLDNLCKEAKMHYKIALNAYVSRYFGRPLEKLNVFFDGVQAKIAQGVKEEEVSFQLAFSKQELRKVLQSITLKEVKKGLEEMYRKIEEHACDTESNLIQVIWHAMQDEFLSQYKAIQAMVERSYPSSNLSLTFTIDDILHVFSEIAQSH